MEPSSIGFDFISEIIGVVYTPADLLSAVQGIADGCRETIRMVYLGSKYTIF